MKATAKPTNHPFEAGRVSTMALIFSVTVPKVWPGSITGARSRSTADLYCSAILFLLCHPEDRAFLRSEGPLQLPAAVQPSANCTDPSSAKNAGLRMTKNVTLPTPDSDFSLPPNTSSADAYSTRPASCNYAAAPSTLKLCCSDR